MLLLGIDVGTSSIKVSVVDADSQQVVASASYPDLENPISTPQPGFAEQDPAMWWNCVQQAILKANATGAYNPKDIGAIGIAYQMHGLVVVDRNEQVLRPSIIWCDSRAVSYGEAAFQKIGSEKALSHLLNSPGNFTAAKLAWVKANEPKIYGSIYQIMLPGDYIAMMLTGSITTSNSALSEGIFWDFQSNQVSEDVLDAFGFPKSILPELHPLFSVHGEVKSSIADLLGLKAGIPVTYKSGDQPNNALSLNVLDPGEFAATAGTSGVVYAVTDQVKYDSQNRVNTFAHVNHQRDDQTRLGILLCINGTGILNRWVRDQFGSGLTYSQLNELAATVPAGSQGVQILPFGNGAERVLENRTVSSTISGLDFNYHTRSHVFRAAQEGIAFSLKYGMDIMATMGSPAKVVRAGKANMFLSDVFTESFVNVTQTPVELYDTDGSKGAALGAGVGLGYFQAPKEAFSRLTKVATVEPNASQADQYQEFYANWLSLLKKYLQ
ncbi:xylulokinase [Siphonobacter curvatus]|uniref:Carbohydrate kinase n=1 Tax=Siphonobacter curvatus TaxID=2094562 RepID=A0A2S7IQV0_9BACT|nr:FGGY family carbohydrate kinase [Siphonobacter curvatus]PQA60049.1 carbohydrate kinase [Siphonobacter curvatus]